MTAQWTNGKREAAKQGVAVVIGGGRGIGRAIAAALAREGWHVVLVARSADELASSTAAIREVHGPGAASYVVADVTNYAAVETAVSSVEGRIGPVELLVNSAGVNNSIGPLWEADPAVWWDDVVVSLRGTFNACHAVLKRMVQRRQGRIINVSSGAGNMAMPMATSYASAKAAVQRLTDSLAVSARPFGVTVFAVSPGTVKTALTERIVSSAAGRRWMPQLCDLPPENWTPVEKIGELAVLIASGAADPLTGRFISVKDDVAGMIDRAEQIAGQDLHTLRIRP